MLAVRRARPQAAKGHLLTTLLKLRPVLEAKLLAPKAPLASEYESLVSTALDPDTLRRGLSAQRLRHVLSTASFKRTGTASVKGGLPPAPDANPPSSRSQGRLMLGSVKQQGGVAGGGDPQQLRISHSSLQVQLATASEPIPIGGGSGRQGLGSGVVSSGLALTQQAAVLVKVGSAPMTLVSAAASEGQASEAGAKSTLGSSEGVCQGRGWGGRELELGWCA